MVSIGISWGCGVNTFNIALTNLSVASINKSQSQWKFQSSSITNFMESCPPEEYDQLKIALSVIPSDVVFELLKSITESPILVTTIKTGIVPLTDEQERVTDINSTVLPTNLLLGQVNVSLKEVNENEKEESSVISSGTENDLSEKRELEQKDETTNDNEERNGVDQKKKH